MVFFISNKDIISNEALIKDLFLIFKNKDSTIFWNTSHIPEYLSNIQPGLYLFYSSNKFLFFSFNSFFNQCQLITNNKLLNYLQQPDSNTFYILNNFFNIFGLGAFFILDIVPNIVQYDPSLSYKFLITDKLYDKTNTKNQYIWSVFHNRVYSEPKIFKSSLVNLYFSWNISRFLSNRLLVKENLIFCKLFPSFKVQNKQLILLDDSDLDDSKISYNLGKTMKGNNDNLFISTNLTDNLSNNSKLTTNEELKIYNIEIETSTNTYKLTWNEWKYYVINKLIKELPESDNKVHILTEIQSCFQTYIKSLFNSKNNKDEYKNIFNKEKKQYTMILSGDDYHNIPMNQILDEIKINSDYDLNIYVNFEEKISWLISDKNNWDSYKTFWMKLSNPSKNKIKENYKNSPNILICKWNDSHNLKKIRSNLDFFDVVIFLINNSSNSEDISNLEENKFIIHFSCNEFFYPKIKYSINQVILKLL